MNGRNGSMNRWLTSSISANQPASQFLYSQFSDKLTFLKIQDHDIESLCE